MWASVTKRAKKIVGIDDPSIEESSNVKPCLDKSLAFQKLWGLESKAKEYEDLKIFECIGEVTLKNKDGVIIVTGKIEKLKI